MILLRKSNRCLSFNYVRYLLAAVLFFFNVCRASGQDSLKNVLNPVETDTIPSLTVKSADSLVVADSAAGNAPLSIEDKEKAWGIKIARDALPETVTTNARDSAVLDVEQSIFYLYGAAKAKYQDIDIESGELIYKQSNHILFAVPVVDTAGEPVSFQQFSQGAEKFTFDTLQYNFTSKRALVRNARSQYGEGFVFSQQVKRNADESIYGWRNLYTTCDLPHPHYGIRANRIKVIPGKTIASGWANLEVQDVPTPLLLPFGLFPIKQGQHSGFILPSYTLESNRGLGLQRGGYYFAVNEYLGIIAQADIFSKGSWAFFSSAQYANRYHYSGNFSLNYSYTKLGEVYEPTGSISKDFRITWAHQVDPKAHPGSSFNANVNVGTSNYNLLNGMDEVNNVLDNQYSSSVSYAKSWIGKPYSLTAALRHSQSTQQHTVTVSIPEVSFNLGQFTPFQRKIMTGSPRWYEQISVSYSNSLKNQWNFIDTTLSLDNIQFSDFNNGFQQSASIGASYNIFRFFNWSINAPYTEYWNTKQIFLHYNDSTGLNDSTVKTGFFASRDFNVSTSLSTRIYGLKMFKKGKIMGLRHVMSPSVSATYTPGFAHAPFGYMYEYVDRYGYITYASPYPGSPFGGPGNPNNSGTVGFRLDNTLQMKVRTGEADSTGSKNVSLIDGLSLNANYDLFADSFNMSLINMSFRTSILDKVNISANAVFDPYVYENGIRTPRYLVDEGMGLVNFRSATFAMGLNFKGDRKEAGNLDSAARNNDEVSRLLQNGGIDDYYDFNIPWNINVNAQMNINRLTRREKADTVIFTPNLTFNGGFNLTERWKLNISSGLLFTGLSKVEMGYTSIDISRDLHCWQMNLNLIPFGIRRSFMFTLQVKASVLQDLKLTRRKAYQDNF